VALWFAPGGEAPTLASAFAAPPFVYEDTTEAPEALRAVGVAFGPSGARVVTASNSGRVATVGTCAAALRFDSSSNGYDAVRSARVARLELAAGQTSVDDDGAHGEAGGLVTSPGYARLTIVKNPKPGKKKAAVLCDERVFVDQLRDQAWLRAARVGLAAAAPERASGPAYDADRVDVLSLTLRRKPSEDAANDDDAVKLSHRFGEDPRPAVATTFEREM
jgi:hypothetical protein